MLANNPPLADYPVSYLGHGVERLEARGACSRFAGTTQKLEARRVIRNWRITLKQQALPAVCLGARACARAGRLSLKLKRPCAAAQGRFLLTVPR